MNAVELYKKLPQKNCGECCQKTCMAFALALIKGDAKLTACPYLPGEEIEALRCSVQTSDWREELILSLRNKIRSIDFLRVYKDLGAEIRDGTLFINCLGREFAVSADGEIRTGGHITPWIKILLLHYINTQGKAPLAGKWASFSELKSGMVKASSFQRECEDPLKELLNADAGKVSIALTGLKAQIQPGFSTTYAWRLSLLPKVPVLILYWPEEDEFPSKVSILFDQTADRFLDVESLMFLLEGLVKNIEMLLRHEKDNDRNDMPLLKRL